MNKLYNPNFENALSQTGYGKFHIFLFILFGAGYSCIAMEMTVISFIIPSAKCDFNMSSSDAGLLNALPSLGIILGSFFWGALADAGGRKWVYSTALFLAGFTSLLSSISQYFYLFVILRFINGFCLAGSLNLSLLYLGEFQPIKYRETVLCSMEMCWTVGIIGLPCLAWLIIPAHIRFVSPYFIYSSWNVFLACTAVPTILLGAWAWTFPESPKFLYEIGEYGKALDVLKYMFTLNTGKDPSFYNVNCLEEKGISIIGESNEPVAKPKRTLRSTIKHISAQAKLLVQKRYLRSTQLVCVISYCLLTGYYTLMMWFPELFSRFQYFEQLYPDKSTSVCEVSSVYLKEKGCQSNIDSKVFLNTLIIGLACIPTSLWLPLCVKKIGAKFCIMFCVTVSGFVTAGMYFVRNSLQNLILSCIFEALTSSGVITLYCALVDLFPTSVRSMATGLSLSFGRLGALTGNLVFGYLIDMNCIIPLVMISTLLFASAIATYFLPIKKRNSPINQL